MHDLARLIERLVGVDENARKLIYENVAFRLNDNRAFCAGYVKFTAAGPSVMRELWKAAWYLKIQ